MIVHTQQCHDGSLMFGWLLGDARRLARPLPEGSASVTQGVGPAVPGPVSLPVARSHPFGSSMMARGLCLLPSSSYLGGEPEQCARHQGRLV